MAAIEWKDSPLGGQYSSDKKWRINFIGGWWSLQQQGVEGYANARSEEAIKAAAQSLADSGQTVVDYMNAQLAKDK